jgi:hypothetical protein
MYAFYDHQQWGKLFLPGDAYPMADSSWYLSVYPWSSCYIRQRWDGFRTRLHTIRHAWVPMAISLHDRRLGPLLPEAQSGQCLSIVGSPRACLTRGLDRWERREGQIGGEIPSARANPRVEKWWHGSFPRLVLFRLVDLPLQPGVVGLFSGMGCMVLQPFATWGNRSYPEFWVVIGDPQDPGYITLTVTLWIKSLS